MPVGDRQPVELLADEAAWKREPKRIVLELGHDPYTDHGTQERYTSRSCGRAVIRVGTNIYGSAAKNAERDVEPMVSAAARRSSAGRGRARQGAAGRSSPTPAAKSGGSDDRNREFSL